MRLPLRCRLGWHAYHYRVTYDHGPTYDKCARCGDVVLVAPGRADLILGGGPDA